MVKVTIALEGQLHRKLVNEAVKEYGSSEKLSLIVNERLKESFKHEKGIKFEKIRIKLGNWLKEKDFESPK
jgi:hypothetical protein